MYGNAADVRRITGLKPGDIGFGTDTELDTWLAARLDEIAVLIDRDRNRSDWDDQGWRAAIDGIATRWAAEFVRFTMASRDSPIIRVDDFQVQVPNDNVPGPGVLKDLRRFPRLHTARHVLETTVVKKPPEEGL